MALYRDRKQRTIILKLLPDQAKWPKKVEPINLLQFPWKVSTKLSLLVAELFTFLRALLLIFCTEFWAEIRVLEDNGAVDLFFGKRTPSFKMPG